MNDPEMLRQGIKLVGQDAVLLLAACPQLLKVRELDLSDNGIGPWGTAPLGRSPYVVNVDVLDLSRNNLGSRFEVGIVSLISGDYGRNLRNMRVLKLSGNRIGPLGPSAIAQSPHLNNLQELDLSDNGINDDRGILQLVTTTLLSKLRSV